MIERGMNISRILNASYYLPRNATVTSVMKSAQIMIVRDTANGEMHTLSDQDLEEYYHPIEAEPEWHYLQKARDLLQSQPVIGRKAAKRLETVLNAPLTGF